MSRFDDDLRHATEPLATEPLPSDILDAALDEPPNHTSWPVAAALTALAVVLVIAVGIGIGGLAPDPSASSSVLSSSDTSPGVLETPFSTPPLPSSTAVGPISASVEEDGIRFTVTLDRDRTRFGQRVMATATIENIGTDSVFWGHGGACPYPAWIQVRPNDPVPMPYGRDDWPGEQGALKPVTVDEDLVAADPVYWFLPEERIDFGRLDCQSVLIVDELPAGESLVQRSGWDTLGHYQMPPPPGSYTVDASFDFMWRGASPAREVEIDEFSVDLTLAIEIEGPAIDYVSPGEAVDALLADQAFQEHFAGLARTRWLRSDIKFSEGRWETALYLMASETEVEPIVAIVGTIDARSGMVLSVAMEERTPPRGE